jgi:ribonuclease HII
MSSVNETPASRGGARVAGVDEAGRGPLAGPVMAAAVILDETNPIEGLADSKMLSAARRAELAVLIRSRALGWCVATASVEEIDRLNILRASLLAMQRAVQGLNPRAERALVDGNRKPELECEVHAIVRGDAQVPAISAASILAKVARDQLMQELHVVYPQYGFAAHKGYPTPMHLAALDRYGPSPIHRRSFAPVRRVSEIQHKKQQDTVTK